LKEFIDEAVRQGCKYEEKGDGRRVLHSASGGTSVILPTFPIDKYLADFLCKQYARVLGLMGFDPFLGTLSVLALSPKPPPNPFAVT
jgi:hypothetical protein